MKNFNQLEDIVLADRKGNTIESQAHQEGGNILLDYTINLTDKATEGHIDPIMAEMKKYVEPFKF